MGKLESLIDEKSINRSGICMFGKSDAIEFIIECKDSNIIILGIDGFYLKGEYTQPSLENSIDFSTGKINEIYERALEFIRNKNNDLYFEIIY